jgi:hypothetical protein
MKRMTLAKHFTQPCGYNDASSKGTLSVELNFEID